MTVIQSEPLVRELWIDAAPEIVFGFLTEAEKLARWMGQSATVEPRPGGVLRIDFNGSDIARGQFVEIVPPERVVFTWGWEGDGAMPPPGTSTVEITLRRDGSGTSLRLEHRDLPAAALTTHGEGWDHFLPKLVGAAASD